MVDYVQVWEAVQEMQSSKIWKVENIPVHVTKDNEVQLATGQPHDLPDLTVPLEPPCIPAGSQLSTMEVLLPPTQPVSTIIEVANCRQ